jgi:methyl-accepting chemotaxis protein
MNLLAGGLIFCTALIVLVGFWGIREVEGQVYLIRVDALPGLDYSGRISNAMGKYRSDVWKHIAASTVDAKRGVEQGQELIGIGIEKDLTAYESSIKMAEDRRNYEDLKSAWNEYVQTWIQEIRPASREGSAEGNAKAFGIASERGRRAFEQAANRLEALMEWNSKRGKELAASSQSALSMAFRLVLGMGALTVVGGMGLSWLVGGNLKRALLQLVNELSSSALQVSSAAVQVSQSSASLAKGAADQAASIEETSASCSEISSMASNNELNAGSAIESMRGSQSQFAAAEEKVGRLVEAMDDINDSSKKISQILGTIDMIAFQTNILALNASVEAARAGTAGMGFAVVAEEVRSLAQRCAMAAKETAEMVDRSVESSNAGSERLTEVVAAIRTVKSETKVAMDRVATVSEGSQQQTQGLGQISKALSQIEQVTQMIAATGEENAASSEELVGQAGALRDSLGTLEALVGVRG